MLKRSLFSLKIGTNKVNIHSSSNLSLNKISSNMFAKDFKYLSLPALNNSIPTSEGPLAFPIFIQSIAHSTSSTSILLTVPTTLLASILYHSIHFQHSLTLPYAPSKFSFDHPLTFATPTFIFNITNHNNILLLLNPLTGNSKQPNTITTQSNLQYL